MIISASSSNMLKCLQECYCHPETYFSHEVTSFSDLTTFLLPLKPGNKLEGQTIRGKCLNCLNLLIFSMLNFDANSGDLFTMTREQLSL